MSIESVLALGLCVLSLVLLVRLAPSAVRSWQIYSGTGHRHQEDAGDRAPMTPSGIEDRMRVLAASGYRPIGVTRVDLPVGERFAWIVAADDGESYGMLVGGLGGVAMTGSTRPGQMGRGLARTSARYADRSWRPSDPGRTNQPGCDRRRSIAPDSRASCLSMHARVKSGRWRTCWPATSITAGASPGGPCDS